MSILIIALVIFIAAFGYLLGKYLKLKTDSIEKLKRQYQEEINIEQEELVKTQKQVEEVKTQFAAESSKLQNVQEQLSESRREHADLQKEIQLEENKVEYARKNNEKLIAAQKESSLSQMRADMEKENSQLQIAYQKKADELKHKYEEEEIQHLQSLKSLEKILQESADKTKEQLNKEIEEIKAELEDYRQRRATINEQIRKEEELKNEQEFHRIKISSVDKQDIQYLLSIEENINNKELLHKLIWSEYIQRPFNQMLKNVLGGRAPKNVIYCIENVNAQKKYIGKTAGEVNKRWTEHIKSSLNIGQISHQEVHDALFKHWDEFAFYVLEEVQEEKLSEREKYYINFFQSDKYGYNIKKGG